MRAPTAVAGLTLGLAAAFAGAWGVGAAVGPVGPVGAASQDERHDDAAHEDAAHGAAEQEDAGHAAVAPGLSSEQDGYSLVVDQRVLPTGRGELSLRVLDEDGEPVTTYTPTHERDLHLVLVRRDGAAFQHLHPVRDASGTWRLPVELAPGTHKVLVDAQPAGRDEPVVLAADVAVPGEQDPVDLPPVVTAASVDGYDVALRGELVPGSTSLVTLSVSRDGVPVPDLQPHLGALGHLVTLRGSDLAYLHTHPENGPPGELRFGVEVPSAGDYLLYLDFRHGDVVRTAPLALTARTGGHP